MSSFIDFVALVSNVGEDFVMAVVCPFVLSSVRVMSVEWVCEYGNITELHVPVCAGHYCGSDVS